MTTALLYTTVVLIWGSTWIMLKFQLGVVAPEASVAYRFAIASVLMFIWAFMHRLPLRFSLRDHLFIILQGALIFSTNFFLVYLSAAYLTTGLVAVVFSTASVVTMLLNALLRRQRPAPRVLFGAMLGVLGIGIIFWPEFEGVSLKAEIGLGVLLCLSGTLCFSLGSIVATRNQVAGLSVRGSTAWAMAYGALLLFVWVVISGKRFAFDPAFPYFASLFYLSVFGSAIVFACYFALLGRIGPERAAYVTVLFPVVALLISTLFEAYQWTLMGFFGVLMTLAGNTLVLMRRRPPVG